MTSPSDERRFWKRVTEYLSGRELNPNQREAVSAADTEVMIEAGPGSGKTTVLTLRIMYLLEVLRVPTQKICVVTFTNAAANEIQERLSRMAEAPVGVQAGTIHRLALRLLRDAGRLRNRELVSDAESLRVIEELLQREDCHADEELAQQVQTEIGDMRNRMLKPKQYKPKSVDAKVFSRVFQGYTAWKREARRIDFDDILAHFYKLLTEQPGRYRGRFDHILVDEFQDTSLLQYDLLRRLAAPSGRLYVVGDVDQSIYGWRGAGPDVMLNFPREYPRCTRILLNQNYRASQVLVETTNRLIAVNQRRSPKRIEAVRAGGLNAVHLTPADDADEARQVVDALERLHKVEGTPWHEMAVIYRLNLQSVLFISELSRRGIPYRILGEPPNSFLEFVGRDIVAYLRLALGERDPELLLRIINHPSRYITHEFTRRATVPWLSGVPLEQAFRLQGASRENLQRVDDLVWRLNQLAQQRPADAIALIRNDMKYDEFVRTYRDSKAFRGKALAHLSLITSLAKGYEDLREFVGFAVAMQERRRGWWRAAAHNGSDLDFRHGVTLTTVHSAKGLEFDAVVVAGLVDGVLPSEDEGASEEGLEAERRLAYVAMTRARHYLAVSTPKELLGEVRKLSPFVVEAGLAQVEESRSRSTPKAAARVGRSPHFASVIQFAVGDKVVHKRFGAGSVLQVVDDRIRVRFEGGEEKTLSLAVCMEIGVLERLEP